LNQVVLLRGAADKVRGKLFISQHLLGWDESDVPGTSLAFSTDERKGCPVNDKPKARRGFASMSPEKQREIASKGGRAAHAKGTAHEWSSGEARDAGRKGGMVSRGGRGKLPADADQAANSAA
jgi:general stress protein YciG